MPIKTKQVTEHTYHYSFGEMSSRSSASKKQQPKACGASDLQNKKIKLPNVSKIASTPGPTASYVDDKRLSNGVILKPKLVKSNPAITNQKTSSGAALKTKRVDHRHPHPEMSDIQHQQASGQQRSAAGRSAQVQHQQQSSRQLPAARPPPLRLPTRAKNPSSQLSQGGYLIHRAEGMFDLSNLTSSPGFKGSIYNLLDEFQKQYEISSVPKLSQTREDGSVQREKASKRSSNINHTEQASVASQGMFYCSILVFS